VRQSLGAPDLALDTPLSEFLKAASIAIGRPLVIVLDQFEQFFVRVGGQSRKAFIAELVDLYYNRDIPIKLVISIRAEWLASLQELRAEIQTILPDMQLLPLDTKSAREAILAPAESVRVSFEAGLVHELLKQLAGHKEQRFFPRIFS